MAKGWPGISVCNTALCTTEGFTDTGVWENEAAEKIGASGEIIYCRTNFLPDRASGNSGSGAVLGFCLLLITILRRSLPEQRICADFGV